MSKSRQFADHGGETNSEHRNWLPMGTRVKAGSSERGCRGPVRTTAIRGTLAGAAGNEIIRAMEATVQLPEALAQRLESLAQEEGTSVDGLIRRLVAEHLERGHLRSAHEVRTVSRKEVRFPLISEQETGVIFPLSGADLDEMFAREDFSS